VADRDFDAESTKQAFEAMDVNKDGKKTRQRVLLRHLCINMIILPRQARDKHRESTQKKDAFLQESSPSMSTQPCSCSWSSRKTMARQ
jgi:hypothetical protein